MRQFIPALASCTCLAAALDGRGDRTVETPCRRRPARASLCAVALCVTLSVDPGNGNFKSGPVNLKCDVSNVKHGRFLQKLGGIRPAVIGDDGKPGLP